MLFYQGTFLSSMGISGAIVVASAVFYGLTFLPALLAIVGRNLGRGRIPIFQPDSAGTGWWHTIATTVMRRPLAVLVPVVAFILLAGSPFLHLRLANNDVTTLPTHEESRAAFDRLVNEFPGGNQTHISVVVEYSSRTSWLVGTTTMKLGVARHGPSAPLAVQFGKYDVLTITGTPVRDTRNDTE